MYQVLIFTTGDDQEVGRCIFVTDFLGKAIAMTRQAGEVPYYRLGDIGSAAFVCHYQDGVKYRRADLADSAAAAVFSSERSTGCWIETWHDEDCRDKMEAGQT